MKSVLLLLPLLAGPSASASRQLQVTGPYRLPDDHSAHFDWPEETRPRQIVSAPPSPGPLAAPVDGSQATDPSFQNGSWGTSAATGKPSSSPLRLPSGSSASKPVPPPGTPQAVEQTHTSSGSTARPAASSTIESAPAKTGDEYVFPLKQWLGSLVLGAVLIGVLGLYTSRRRRWRRSRKAIEEYMGSYPMGNYIDQLFTGHELV